MYKRYFKRGLDIFGALTLLVFMFPVISMVWIVLLIVNKGGVFFNQIRPGLNEKPFLLYKFKTMKDSNVLEESKRISKVGDFLRKTSLDELPQLINVLKGEMSLIGPRPLLMEYLPLYSDYQRKRHSVLPGITGWAQVKGRNSLSWEEKFELDIFYIRNVSFFLDLKILVLSIFKILPGKGVYAENGQIVKKFAGNKDL